MAALSLSSLTKRHFVVDVALGACFNISEKTTAQISYLSLKDAVDACFWPGSSGTTNVKSSKGTTDFELWREIRDLLARSAQFLARMAKLSPKCLSNYADPWCAQLS